ELEFNDLPADNTAIDVEYRENLALPNIFKINNDFQVGTVQLQVDGNDVAFTQTGERSFTLATPPADGARVEISYEVPGNRTLSYPVSTTDGEPEKLQAFDVDSGKQLKVE